MGFASDGYYSFERDDGGHDGLVRVSNRGTTFQYVDSGQWIENRDLARHFVNPGSTFLEAIINETAARQLATRYGVELLA